MNNPSEFEVLLKKGGRTVRRLLLSDPGEADRVAKAWYQEGDGHTFEINGRPKVLEQEHLHKEIPPDQYLTQAQTGYNPVNRP